MTTHLLVDYGEVIAQAQPEVAVRGMAALVGLPLNEFRSRYWAARAPYDAGQAAPDYWEQVIGRPTNGSELQTLRRLDLESWTHLNFATITALRHAHRRGARLTLLSNAPHDLANDVRQFPALTDMFSLLLFSAELGINKPAAEIYTTALALTETSPQETLFIDDRTENLAAAAALGIRTHLFTSADGLCSALRGIGFGPQPNKLNKLNKLNTWSLRPRRTPARFN